MYKFQYLLFAFLVPSTYSLQCLVIRPGYGLVTESCPVTSSGCRIRISKNAVDFYEYSALYDRNQYVCVHKTEFDEAKQSGCLRKKNGHVRCWCYAANGRSNCNTAETSKALYEAFITEDKDYFNKVIREIDSSPLVTDFSPSMKAVTTTTTTPTTTNAPEIIKVPILRKNNGGMLRGGSSPASTSSGTGSIILGKDDSSPFVRHPGSRKVDSPKKPSDDFKDIEGESLFSKSSTGNDQHKLRHHHYRTDEEKEHNKRLSSSSRGSFSNKGPEEVQRQSMLVEDGFPTTLRPTIKPKPKATTEKPNRKTKVIFEKNSEIQVITVGSQDQYDLQNSDSASLTQAQTLPTEVTPDDLYDEEELAKLDAEYAEHQKRQNRPVPLPESPMQPVLVLPQEDDDVTEEVPEPMGEYFDSNSSATISSLISFFVLCFLLLIREL